MPETYKYSFDPSKKTYTFITNKGITINVVISRDRRWFPYNTEIKEVFSFDIITDRPSLGLDVLIRNTIIEIIGNHLNDIETVIVFFCDPEDGKGAKRDMKFSRWFDHMSGESIEKHDRKVYVKDTKIDELGNEIEVDVLLYSSMLIHKENSLYKTITRVFQAGDKDVTEKL